MALLAAYNFDEPSGDVLDRSGNGRSWALNTGAQRTTGDGGHTDEGLTKLGAGFATLAATAFGQTTARTLMFWMRGAGNGVWWVRWYITADDTGAWGIYQLGGNVTLRARKGGANTNITVAMPGDGGWHHYAGTYDGSNTRLYLDGVLVATSGAVTAPLDTADLIDCMETSLTTQTMDDLRIYDTALDQATIAALMDTPVVASGGSVTGAAVAALGGVTAAASGIRVVPGAAVTLLGACSSTASGVRRVSGAGVGSLGGLVSAASGSTPPASRTGAGAAVLGGLVGSARAATPLTVGSGWGSLAAIAAENRRGGPSMYRPNDRSRDPLAGWRWRA